MFAKSAKSKDFNGVCPPVFSFKSSEQIACVLRLSVCVRLCPLCPDVLSRGHGVVFSRKSRTQGHKKFSKSSQLVGKSETLGKNETSDTEFRGSNSHTS